MHLRPAPVPAPPPRARTDCRTSGRPGRIGGFGGAQAISGPRAGSGGGESGRPGLGPMSRPGLGSERSPSGWARRLNAIGVGRMGPHRRAGTGRAGPGSSTGNVSPDDMGQASCGPGRPATGPAHNGLRPVAGRAGLGLLSRERLRAVWPAPTAAVLLQSCCSTVAALWLHQRFNNTKQVRQGTAALREAVR